MNNTSKFLAIGLVIGGGIGIVAGILMDNIIMGLAIGATLDRRAKSQA